MEDIRVFVDEQPVVVPVGSTVRDAITRHDPGAANRLDSSRALVTDGRGLPLAPDAAVRVGDILRVVTARRRAGE